ncbi:Blp family class II bacteriocin [Phreatobacter sp. AB_2022a]|uniref:Blp family class II bacteriocin n=1 Tax=Phreatobacter sp. AB_2022a TaxID=3003134 RepID=UPI002286F95C|nr:Blp family class II bacteriocin [Phreatobacter sp. AB_2022a]MCZ0733231.1 Blp family class II bacteriocin [Phreatobacter sp. AB_2022a]
MTSKTDGTVALTDASLETVNGGFDVVKQLEHIGESTLDGAKTGGRIGILGGPVFAFGGMGAGAILGAIGGVKDAVGDGVNEAVAGLKTLLK